MPQRLESGLKRKGDAVALRLRFIQPAPDRAVGEPNHLI